MATASTSTRTNRQHLPHTCTIALHSLSENDTTVFRSMVGLFNHKLSTKWSVISDHDNADMHIVDVDSPEGRLQWERLPPNCLKTAFSSRTLLSATKPLRKPLFGKQVCELLQNTGEALTLSRLGGLPLFDHLENDAFTTTVSIEFDDQLPELWIDPQKKRYLFGCDLDRIASSLATPMVVSEINQVGRFEWQQRASLVEEKPLSRLKWYAAWATSSNQLSSALKQTTPLRLVDWPEMECHRPDLFRLAGHLLNDAISFDQLLRETRIDEKTAAKFVNTCYRCGLIGTPGQDLPAESTAPDAKPAGLLSRIRHHVGL